MNTLINRICTLKEINGNVAREFLQCASYFHLAAGVTERAGDNGAAARYRGLEQFSIDLAVVSLTQQGNSEETVRTVALTQLEQEFGNMLQEIGNDDSKAAMLTERLEKPCEAALADPVALMHKWEKRIIEDAAN